MVVFAVILFVTCFFVATMLRDWKMDNVWCKSLISYMAAITLELYIVQQLFIYYKKAQPLTAGGNSRNNALCDVTAFRS